MKLLNLRLSGWRNLLLAPAASVLLASPALAGPRAPAGAAPASAAVAYSHVEVFAHSEAKSVMDAVDSYRGELHDGRVAYAYSRAEAGWQRESWRIGAIVRYDLAIDPSRDFVRLYHLTRNRLPLPVGESFDLRLRAQQYQLAGVVLGKQWQPHSSLQLRGALSLLRGTRFIDGSARGTATILAENNYDITGRVNYAYETDELLDRRTDNISGYGFSIDFGLSWNITAATSLSLDIYDLYGEVRWQDAPFTRADIITSSRRVENGYAVFDPAISGFEGNKDFDQRLWARANMQLNQQLANNYRLQLKYRLHRLKAVPSVAIGRHHASKRVSWQLELLPIQRAAGIGLQWRGFTLQYLASDLRFDDAQVLGLQLGYQHAF